MNCSISKPAQMSIRKALSAGMQVSDLKKINIT